MGQTAIDGVEGLIGPAKSADSAVRGRWRCRLYHSGRAYFATVATADYHGTVAHRHVDHAGTMCADYVAQFRSPRGNRRHRFGHHPADFAYRRHGLLPRLLPSATHARLHRRHRTTDCRNGVF